VKLNFSKSGVSTTVGPKGFHFTFGKRGVRRTVSIPGTGVSEVDYIKKNGSEAEKDKKARSEQRRETRAEEKQAEHESRVSESRAEPRHRRRTREATTTSGSTELRNAFVLLGIVVFFFAGAAVLGFIPAHFVSNSLQYIVHLVQSTGL
jgi:stringent starvation protein B